MSAQRLTKFLRIAIAGYYLFFTHFDECIAGVSVAIESGSQQILTNYSRDVSGCEGSSIDRRISLGIAPRLKRGTLELFSTGNVENQIADRLVLRPFHQTLIIGGLHIIGRHQISAAMSHDTSEDVLWGCAASLAARLKREQRIQEDLQVSGQKIVARQRMFEYVFDAGDTKYGLIGTGIEETGDYGRFQRDSLLVVTQKVRNSGLLTLKSGLGDEGIRNEKYRNIRAMVSYSYVPSRLWNFNLAIGDQRRGDRERILNWDIRIANKVTKHFGIDLSTNRVISKDSPRFSTLTHRVNLEHAVGSRRLGILLGRAEVENPQNSNNIISSTYEHTLSHYHKIKVGLSQGTEYVAVVRTSQAFDAGYVFTPFERFTSNRSSALNIGVNYTRTVLLRENSPESDIDIVELSLKGIF